MPGAATPTPQDVERALRRLSADQFTQVCSEIGILEMTLPGSTQVARARALVERTRGGADFAVLTRAITRVDPGAWRPIPARAGLSSLAYGLIAFAAIVILGGLVLVVVLSGSEQAAQQTPTPTETLAPTRTPVPTFTHTPAPSPLPSATLTATPTATSTRAQAPTASARGPTPTTTTTPFPTPAVVYPKVEPQQPRSGYRAFPNETLEFRWVLRGSPIAADERYLMRTYASTGALADSYLTSDPWRFAVGGPSNAIGTFTWTVTVVKVDTANNVIGPVSPESDPWTITWQP
jgi:hypothetical protein